MTAGCLIRKERGSRMSKDKTPWDKAKTFILNYILVMGGAVLLVIDFMSCGSCVP